MRPHPYEGRHSSPVRSDRKVPCSLSLLTMAELPAGTADLVGNRGYPDWLPANERVWNHLGLPSAVNVPGVNSWLTRRVDTWPDDSSAPRCPWIRLYSTRALEGKNLADVARDGIDPDEGKWIAVRRRPLREDLTPIRRPLVARVVVDPRQVTRPAAIGPESPDAGAVERPGDVEDGDPVGRR